MRAPLRGSGSDAFLPTMVRHNGYATCANVHISLASRDKFLRALYSYAARHVACLNGRCDGRGEVRYECRIRTAMESMMLRFWLHSLLVTPCLVSLLVAPPASAADPPARSPSSPVTVMDNQGRVLKTLKDPPTKEALAAKAAEEERERDKAKVDAEQARKDRILLDSYTTEGEIDLARNRASHAIEQQMEIARSYTASLAKRQAELQKQKSELGAKGLPPAEEQELGRLKAEIEAQNASVMQKKQDLERIVARYAADKRRWQEIGEKERLARPAATGAAPTK